MTSVKTRGGSMEEDMGEIDMNRYKFIWMRSFTLEEPSTLGKNVSKQFIKHKNV